jgi:hypothetical protein
VLGPTPLLGAPIPHQLYETPKRTLHDADLPPVYEFIQQELSGQVRVSVLSHQIRLRYLPRFRSGAPPRRAVVARSSSTAGAASSEMGHELLPGIVPRPQNDAPLGEPQVEALVVPMPGRRPGVTKQQLHVQQLPHGWMPTLRRGADSRIGRRP